MHNRSWLIVPGDNEAKLGKSSRTAADVVIIDLDSSVPQDAKPHARQLAAQWLDAHRHRVLEKRSVGRWVRINTLESGFWRDDLSAVMPWAPDGIVLPKALGPEMVRQLAAELYEFEQRHQIPSGRTKILPIVGETPRAVMSITSYIESPHQRLFGFSWQADELSAALGASRKFDAAGNWVGGFQYVRAQTLLTAHACGALAVETLHSDLSDKEGLKAAAAASRADGFSGMLAIHPDQVPVINEAFTVSEGELRAARRIVEAFDENPTASVLQVDRRMVDQPQLILARRMLGLDGPGGQAAGREPILRLA